MRFLDRRLSIGRGGERRHHSGDTERARTRLSLAPSFRNDIDDRAAAFFPIVVRQALAVGTRCAALHLRDIGRAWRSKTERCAELIAHRLDQQSSIRNSKCEWRDGARFVARIDGAAEQQIALAAIVGCFAASTVPAEGERRCLYLPRSPA